MYNTEINRNGQINTVAFRIQERISQMLKHQKAKSDPQLNSTYTALR